VVELGSRIVEAVVYQLAGLRIVSNFPLSGLPPCHNNDATGQQQVIIRRAPVPESLAGVAVRFPNGQYNGKEILLDFPRVGRFLLRDGNEILVDPAPAASDGDVLAYLLGTAFGILYHQRGITPLHASVIDVADGCVAFVGASGAGKSTLVAALSQRGHQVIADDVCCLQLDDNGVVQAWSGLNRIRLWEDAMAALGCDGPGVQREMRGYNKYLIPARPASDPMKPRRLRRVYALHAAPDGGAAIATQIRGAEVLEVLMQNIYRLEIAQRMGYKPAAFVVCAAAARDVPVFRFSRPLAFGALDGTIAFLEDHLLDLEKLP
jgi:hypothetical protein